MGDYDDEDYGRFCFGFGSFFTVVVDFLCRMENIVNVGTLNSKRNHSEKDPNVSVLDLTNGCINILFTVFYYKNIFFIIFTTWMNFW